jgi:hypothetical protein
MICLRRPDLYEQAAQMVQDAGAAGDDKARRRLMACCQGEVEVITLGNVFPSIAESSAQHYQRAIQEINEEP